jgi:hypothetical protein
MTVAVAVCCPEGAVIAADGLSHSNPPSADSWLIGPKVEIVPEAPWAGAWFSFWTRPIHREPLPLDLATAASMVWYWTRGATFHNPSPLRAQPQVLMAGTDADGRVRLVHLTTGLTEWAPPAGAVYVAGLATVPEAGITIEPPAAPQTLQDAVQLAVRLVRDYIAAWYRRDGMWDLRDYQAAGLLPPVGEPVHAAVIEPGRVHLEETWAPA